jgi:hypothetical protein
MTPSLTPNFHPSKLLQLAEIVPYSRNAREHSDAQIGQIAASIREFGFTNPVLVDENSLLIAGHGRLAAARFLGMAQLPAIVIADLSDAQKQALRLADNKLALNASWNDELLRTELADLRDVGFDLALTGFGDDELAGLFDRTVGLTDPDEVPEPPAEPVTQLGDVWLLGVYYECPCGTRNELQALRGGIRPEPLQPGRMQPGMSKGPRASEKRSLQEVGEGAGVGTALAQEPRKKGNRQGLPADGSRQAESSIEGNAAFDAAGSSSAQASPDRQRHIVASESI